ncbi:Tyrosine recombinase XerC [subsurface metagenome]
MLLDHLTTDKTQIGAVSGLDHLTTQNNFEGWLQAFLLSCRVDGLSPATLKNYQYQLGRFASFCLKSKIGARAPIDAQQIRLFFLKLRETNSPISVGDYYKSIKRFFNWLVDEGLIEKSPMQNIKPPRKEERLIRPFSQQDIDNLLLLVSSNRFVDLRNKAIILVFLDTGLRLSELANIQLVDINFNREVIKVMGKGAKERVVRIGKTAQKALLRYLLLRHDNYPCLWVTEERRPLTRGGIQIAVKKLCHRAEITDAKCGPHTFRHTFATQAMLNGASEREVQSLLGHSSQRMTQQYTATINSEHAIKSHERFSPVDNMSRK